ncbi:CRISPR system precrRNA processing endoribonuclease RAMP protein Cas6 [Leptolyngbya sp. AN03gr2]|uniref:CRISPR system precrRNA processing endoribonuclease RAMP protein Cas6 n=1 Tax=unclassified Leptolyngbya TaxID=2650499 RepID=UPI003D31B4FD
MPRRPTTQKPLLTWSTNTELIGITLTLRPTSNFQAPTHYTTELHSWFLNQIRHIDPTLSAYLHDGQSEKAFTLSGLSGDITPQARSLHFHPDRTYQWSIAALSKAVCQGLQKWLINPPKLMQLRSGEFSIEQWQISLPATTYETLWETANSTSSQLCLTFTTPTSFRKRSNHMPLPIPENVFQSYFRRWNDFAHLEFEQSDFLNWVNDCVVILRHDIRSQKTQAGKQGSVTGFTGAVQFGLTSKAKTEPEYVQLVHALIACAPYFATGHKVTFGLGQTQLGWQTSPTAQAPENPITRDRPDLSEQLQENSEHLRHQRQQELKHFFFNRKKRKGGDRAEKAADLWATIIAYQEFGASLKDIASHLEMSYDTVKHYANRARRELNDA